jgi:hypothetical protein
MSRGQRLTFLGIAALIAVVAIFVLADSSEDASDGGDRAAATATATPEATAAPQEASPAERTAEPTPEPPPLLTAGEVAELEYTEGERARFRVRSPEPEEIHVHGYDIYRDIPAGETVTVSFPADITGIFEIELHGSGEPIAELRVNPK